MEEQALLPRNGIWIGDFITEKKNYQCNRDDNVSDSHRVVSENMRQIIKKKNKKHRVIGRKMIATLSHRTRRECQHLTGDL